MSNITIKTCSPGDKDFLYAGNTVIDHHYLVKCVVAHKEQQPCGRLCVYNNPYNTHDGEDVLLFGNFDCNNDVEIARTMIDFVAEEARKMDIEYIAGPINGNTWNDYRLPVKGEQPAFMGDLNQPSYYKDSLLQNGFKVWHNYFSAVAPIEPSMLPDEQVLQQLKDEGVQVRGINTDDLDTELKKIYTLCAAAFKDNILFSPVDEQTFVSKYKQYALLMSSDYVLLAEHEGRVIGLTFAYPDNSLENKRVIIKTLARHPQYRVKGLVDTLIRILYRNAAANGCTHMVHAFMHEDNKSLVLSKQYKGTVIREYAVFIKSITG